MIAFLQANSTELFKLSDLQLIAPEIILAVCACVVLVMEVILPYRKSKWTAYFALIGIGLALVSLLAQFYGMAGTFLPWNVEGALSPLNGFYGMIRIDGFAVLFKIIFLLAAALSIAISTNFLYIDGEQHGEDFAFVLFATVGMSLLSFSYSLFHLFICL